MAEYRKELVQKIVRMLESDHDGERASAAGKLHAIAKENGKNIDELMAHCYANGGQSSSAGSGRRRDPFEDVWEDVRRASANADRARRERERAEAKAEADRRERERERREQQQAERAFKEKQRRANATGFNPGTPGGYKKVFLEPLLQTLYELFDQWGADPLTSWEQDFVTDVLARGAGYRTSPTQDAVIEKIIEKYGRFAKRNGDEASFWNA